MSTTQIVLTHQPGLGWNYTIHRSGKPLPAEDPQDFDQVTKALQAALTHLQQSLRPHPDGGSS